MATYYGTYGQKVQYLASDPSDPQIGQVWYNSTSATLKVRQLATVNAWASGGNLNQARTSAGAIGTQTATLVFGGGNNLSPMTTYTATEKYNGTSWTSNPTGLNTTRTGISGAGTQTAGLGFGGNTGSGPGFSAKNATESFNGSTWTSVNNMNTARAATGIGIQTAALAAGGGAAYVTFSSAVESWNGTSWTTAASLPGTTGNLGSTGTNTAALVIGGTASPATTLSYNGTSWTSGGNLNLGRYGFCAAGGTQTASIGAGGYAPSLSGNTGSTELYNGTSWTTSTSMTTARRFAAGNFGAQTATLAAGGYSTTAVATTEEWTGIEAQTKTVTVS